MAEIYKQVKVTSIGIGGGGGSESPAFERTFILTDWSLVSGNFELTISSTLHQQGQKPLVQVEELDGSIYREVDAVVENNNGNIKIIVGNDSRFVGRVLIKE